MAIIKIKNLRVNALIGVYEFERNIRQPLIINIKVKFDGSLAARSDDLTDTIDYQKLKRSIIELAETSGFLLLEALTEAMLDLIFEEPLVKRAKVEIDKPNALNFVDSVSLSKSRKR